MKVRIEVPVTYVIDIPDGMPDAEVRRRVWEEIRDGGETLWSSSGFGLERLPPKRAEVWEPLSVVLWNRAFYNKQEKLRKAQDALRAERIGKDTSQTAKG